MFSNYGLFKDECLIFVEKLNFFHDFEAEFVIHRLENVVESEFFTESDCACLNVRKLVKNGSKGFILTLIFVYSGDSFPESFFQVRWCDSRKSLTLEEMRAVLPTILFKKIELDMPRFDQTSNMGRFNGSTETYKLNLCGLRDEYNTLKASIKAEHDLNRTMNDSGDKDEPHATNFNKIAGWASWVMNFFGEGLPSDILIT